MFGRSPLSLGYSLHVGFVHIGYYGQKVFDPFCFTRFGLPSILPRN